jgi:hypothetical protein
MKYLLDVHIPPTVLELQTNQIMRSVDILPINATDKEILDKANELGLQVITSDKGFIQLAVDNKTEIIYQSNNGLRYKIKAEPVPIQPSLKITDKRSRYILLNDKVVIP